mgnify:CR=1 FL=1
MDIRRIQDIDLEDINLRTRYYTLFQSGNIDQAKIMYNTYPQLQGKVLNAETLNQFVESVIELETNYYTNVEDKLKEDRELFQLEVDELVYMSEYKSDFQYEVNNFVLYLGNIYYCFTKPPIGTSPTNSDYWIELGLKGDIGTPTLGVAWRGEWNPIVNYKQKDMVIYDNKIYVAKEASVGTVPTVESYWILALNNVPQSIYISYDPPEHALEGSIWIKIKEIDYGTETYMLEQNINIGNYINFTTIERSLI